MGRKRRIVIDDSDSSESSESSAHGRDDDYQPPASGKRPRPRRNNQRHPAASAERLLCGRDDVHQSPAPAQRFYSERDKSCQPPVSTNRYQYRASRTGGRSVRDQIDHDVFSGLPVRHWRKQPIAVNPTPLKDLCTVGDAQKNGWPELPMPKDSHLLPPWSQALLRAARMGQVFRPPTVPVEEDKDAGEDEDAEGDIEPGFVATRWGVVPRHLEGPEPEFLAKRRKGLPSLYGGASEGAVAGSDQMRKTKIRKTDADGTDHVLEALVPVGQAVEGEIAEETIVSEAPAPGTVVDGVGIVNAEGVVVAGDQMQPTPPRRRPPPPKRKAKGPGRGRKKKVEFAPGTEGMANIQGVDGGTNGHIGPDGQNSQAAHSGDIEMGEDSTLQEGEEGSEDEEDGEEGEEGDREDGELSPSPTPATKSPSRDLRVLEPEDPHGGVSSTIDSLQPPVTVNEPSSSPDLPLGDSRTFPVSDASAEPSDTPQDLSLYQTEHTQNEEKLPSSEIQPPTITVEPAKEAVTFSAPKLEDIPPTNEISIGEPPQIHESRTHAVLPAEHDPLDGLTEPKAADAEPATDTMHFPDGEEDLLGSLERHLDKQG